MGYYYNTSLFHADKRDKGMNSTTNEKGTDGKRNNSSEYNHQYYMKNKEKWQDNKDGAKYGEYKDGDPDFDEKNYDEKNRLGDTDFYGFQRPDGTWVILEEDMKWEVPKGMSKEDLIKSLEDFDKKIEAQRQAGNYQASNADWVKNATEAINSAARKAKESSGEQEFDVDAAAMDVIRGKYKNGAERKAALGEDYEMVQKRVNELMKQQKSSGSGSSKTSTSSSNSNKSNSSNASSSSSSEAHWRGKGGSSTSSSSAQNDEKKEETTTRSTSNSSRPRSRTRHITGSAKTSTRSSLSSPTRTRNLTHSEVRITMNDWRLYIGDEDYLAHHGIKGQKWGVRRFQNSDGSLTSEGQKRYGASAGKVEKSLMKATRLENKAANAKTKFGRDWNTSRAINARVMADTAAAKAEGDYHPFLQSSKDMNRRLGSQAEAQASIAQKLKDRASGEMNEKKYRKLMDEAVGRLASAENSEIYAKAWNEVANAKGIINKGVTYFNEMDKASKTSYTAAGRKQTIGDKKLEALGDFALSTAFGLATGTEQNMSGVMKGARDQAYRKNNSAETRWDNILKDKG